MNQQPDQAGTPGEKLKAMRILVLALITGASMFTLIVAALQVFTLAGPKKGIEDIKDILLYVAAGLGLIAVVAANKSYLAQTGKLREQPLSLNEKLDIYRTILIRYMALCEAPALFGVIVYFLTGDHIIVIMVAVALAAMLYRLPSKNKIISELNAGTDEQILLDK